MSSAAPTGWDGLVEDLAGWMPPDWTRQVREHGGQAWVRLVALVDAHHQLSQPRITEKIAQTLGDLAEGQGLATERQGWEMIRERSRGSRHEVLARLVDAGPQMLPDDLAVYFTRSIDPLAVK